MLQQTIEEKMMKKKVLLITLLFGISSIANAEFNRLRLQGEIAGEIADGWELGLAERLETHDDDGLSTDLDYHHTDLGITHKTSNHWKLSGHARYVTSGDGFKNLSFNELRPYVTAETPKLKLTDYLSLKSKTYVEYRIRNDNEKNVVRLREKVTVGLSYGFFVSDRISYNVEVGNKSETNWDSNNLDVGWGTKVLNKKLALKLFYRYDWGYEHGDFKRHYEMLAVTAKYKF